MAMKRVFWSFAFGILYTIGFFVAFRMMWIDLTDEHLILESAIGHMGHALLYSLYAPITLSGLDHTDWVFPSLFLFGFIGAWLILLLSDCRRKRHSHVD
jgi:hypothetical protein